MNFHSNIAIIPARGGSQRILRKNIKEFCGKPIIAYSIEMALRSGLFERVIVSTDDYEIADVAREYDAEVPFMRPEHLSDDFTGTGTVFLHALEWLKEREEIYDYACCIYATAPFIQMKYLKEGLNAISNCLANSSFTVTSYPSPIFRSLKINSEGYVEMFWPEYKMKRSQDLPSAYHDAGQFYWVKCQKFIEERSIWSKKSIPIILPRYLVHDIDTEEDWITAELMYQALRDSAN